jgi:hypothetical protein
MIHNSSSDPVLIKKISLKIWSLRDEIESRIQEKLDAGEIVPEGLENSLVELRDQYAPKKKTEEGNVINMIGDAPVPDDGGENEMAKAMAEAIEGEEAAPTEEVNPDNVVSLTTRANAQEIQIGIEAPHLDDSKISKGKTVLSEINMDKMFFFSNRSFTEGQSIVIQFCIPKTFIMNADVLYCRPFNIKSRIISQNNYTHRMLVKFNFLKEGERALLREFIQSIEPDVPKMIKKPETEENESNESGFDELDDLGL